MSSRALLCLLTTSVAALLLIFSATRHQHIVTSVIPTTPIAAAVESVEEPSAVTLSAWDAELNAHHRTLLRLRPQIADRQLVDPPPAAGLNGSAIHCKGHGQLQPVRGGDGRWTLRCACDPGFTGAACELPDPSPCNTPEGGRVLTRCAGTCDESVNRCVCGPSSRFPQRPMVHCRYDGVEKDMPYMTPNWANFALAPKSHFWTDGGPARASSRRGAAVSWCDADPALQQRPLVRCRCYDGQDANQLCAPVAPRSVDATFCPNQCMMHGECVSGFCRCGAGWIGADCSMRAGGGGGAVLGSSSGGGLATASTSGRGGGGGGGGKAGGASSSTTDDLPPSPRVFVYELPGEFNSFQLARRQSNDACAIREYHSPASPEGRKAASGGGGGGGGGDGKVVASWTNTLYGAEVALHEALLASPHRVLDPKLADYFYVPVYGGCFISEFNRPSPRHWLCDRCHLRESADLASLRAMRWHEALLAHIRTSYPYWNASNGADHLWPFTHDEGACYAPAALQRATLLTHWGRMHLRPNGSSEYHLWRVRPHAK